jgi:hypothetical protein
MTRYFTRAQAEALLPEIDAGLRNARRFRDENRRAGEALQQATQRIHVLGGTRVNPSAILALRAQRDTAAAGFKESVEQIHSLGCLIKDLDLGLVDFPALYRGAEVYLCWKLGEPAIEYWHGVDEGFAGRKIIDDDFLAELRGAPEN